MAETHLEDAKMPSNDEQRKALLVMACAACMGHSPKNVHAVFKALFEKCPETVDQIMQSLAILLFGSVEGSVRVACVVRCWVCCW